MEGDKAAMLHVEIEQNQGLIHDALLHASYCPKYATLTHECTHTHTYVNKYIYTHTAYFLSTGMV